MLWAWKGDYINMGAGAEIGFYFRPEALSGSPFWFSDPFGYKPNMTVSLRGTDNKMIVTDNLTDTKAKIWTGAWNPHVQGLSKDDLRATMTIDFSDNTRLFDDLVSNGKYDPAFWKPDRTTRTVELKFRRRKRWVR